MNRTLKEATVQRFHYKTTHELNEHLQTLLLAYNHAKRHKALRGLTPHEFVCAQRQKNPVNFNQDPTRLTLRLYTQVHMLAQHRAVVLVGFRRHGLPRAQKAAG